MTNAVQRFDYPLSLVVRTREVAGSVTRSMAVLAPSVSTRLPKRLQSVLNAAARLMRWSIVQVWPGHITTPARFSHAKFPPFQNV